MKIKFLHRQTRWGSALALSLSALALSPTAVWALGSNVASFTYTGSQTGFTPGTVYTLATEYQNLGFCQLTPPTSTGSGYSAQCFTNYGTSDSSLYSAVAYLGSVNNPNNQFVVGDNNGNLYTTSLNFELSNGSYVVPSLTAMTPVSGSCPSGSQVFSLAVDPNGQYLYVGCYGTSPRPTNVLNSSLVPYYLNPVAVLTAPINSDGTLGSFSIISNLFYVTQFWTAAVWNGVSPVMRSYPAQAPQLANSAYAQSGAVMVSGLVGGLYTNTNKNGQGPVPGNAGVICSNGQCEVAYNVILDSETFSVMTAAELGVDYYNGNYGPALYHNQVQGTWTTENIYGLGTIPVSQVPWSKTSNTIYSCNLAESPIGSPEAGQSCAAGSYALQWTPPKSNIPSAGNGMQVDISNLLFIPTPSDTSTTYTHGLLTIGTWSNGYLAYHSPATENNTTAQFLAGNGDNGQVGNVNSMINDVYGNLMYATSTGGLFVFNPFAGSNTADGTNITLIPNTVDSTTSGSSGLLNTIKTGTQIAYFAVKTIAVVSPKTIAVVAPSLMAASTLADDAFPLTSNKALGRVLGAEPYRGQFLYTEQELQAMGIEPGTILRGVRLRSAEGITPSLDNIERLFNGFKIALSEARTIPGTDDLDDRFAKNIGKRRKTVKTGPLVRPDWTGSNQVYPDSISGGEFWSPIWFDKNYHYRGGPLLMEVTQKGNGMSAPILIDAWGTGGLQGVYKPLTKGSQIQRITAKPAVEFVH